MNTKKALLLGVLAASLAVLSACGGQQGAAGAELQGTLVNLCGQPLPYMTVYVPGHEPVLTGLDGKFVIEDVAAPYDLAIGDAYLLSDTVEELPILVYQGLTVMEPRLAVKTTGDRNEDGCLETRFFGSLTTTASGGSLYSAHVSGFTGAGNYYETWSAPDGGSYDATIYTAPDEPAYLKTLLWEVDGEGEIAAFVAGAYATLTPNGDEVEENLELEPLGTLALSATVSTPAAVSLAFVASNAVVSGSRGFLELQRREAGDAVNGVFSFLVPDAAGWGSLLMARGTYGRSSRLSVGGSDIASVEGQVFSWRRVFEFGEEAVNLSLPEPVVPVTPLQGSVVGPDTTFSWVGPEGMVYDSMLQIKQDGPDISVEVITQGTSLSLPELSGLGVSYDAAGRLYWQIAAWKSEAMPATVDGFADFEMVRTIMSDMQHEYPGDAGSAVFCDAGSYGVAASQER